METQLSSSQNAGVSRGCTPDKWVAEENICLLTKTRKLVCVHLSSRLEEARKVPEDLKHWVRPHWGLGLN